MNNGPTFCENQIKDEQKNTPGEGRRHSCGEIFDLFHLIEISHG